MRFEENYFKNEDPEDDNDVTQDLKDLINSKNYPPEVADALKDLLESYLKVRLPEMNSEGDECPVIDMVEDMLMASYEPKPFGIPFTDSDIKEFLEDYGYKVLQAPGDDDEEHFMALQESQDIPGTYQYSLDYKKVFIDLCRSKAKKLLLKIFKDL